MKLTIKSLMLIGVLLQGYEAFAQGFKISADSKIIINIGDSYNYHIPGGVCGDTNTTLQGPGTHNCKVRPGGSIAIVYADDIYCSFEETITGKGLILKLAARAKKCSQILDGPLVQDGNDIRINIKNKVLPPIVIKMVSGSSGHSYKLQPQPTGQKCNEVSLMDKGQYDCTADGNIENFKIIVRGKDKAGKDLGSRNLAYNKSSGFTSDDGCTKMEVTRVNDPGSSFRYNLQ